MASRRKFLGGVTGAAAAASVAPWVWVPKKAFAAASPGFGTAKRVLVLYAGGGLRSAPLFNADVAFQHNPFGAAANIAPGAQWTPGTLLGTQPIPLFSFEEGAEMPAVPAIANDIAILAGVDHQPDGPSFTDHFLGDMTITGGDPDSETGLLARIYKHKSSGLPPFDLGLSNFGRGAGEFAGFRPIALQSAREFAGRGTEAASKADWARALRERRDERFVAKRAPHVRPYLGAARDAKKHSKIYAAMLRDPALDLIARPEASLGGVTNQQLLEALGANPFAPPEMAGWGTEIAFALRAFQMGVPAVSVMRYVYDTHSDEATLLPIDGGDLGRQIAGLHFLLHRMTDLEGQPLWDSTVVLVVSECSRDNTDPATGFNSAEGSDHQGSPAARNQCLPIFGGPITARGRKIGGLDPQSLEPLSGRAIPTQAVHASLLDLLGIDSSQHFTEAPLAELFA